MTTIEILKRARELIRRGWVRGYYHYAGRYCAVGAILKVTADLPGGFAWEAEDALNTTLYADGNVKGLLNFNDEQKSRKPVIALYDRTIARLEGTNA